MNTSQCTNYQMPPPRPWPAARYHAALVAVSIHSCPSCCQLAKRLFEFFLSCHQLLCHIVSSPRLCCLGDYVSQVKLETCHKNWVVAFHDGFVRDSLVPESPSSSHAEAQDAFEVELLGFQD